MSDKKESTNSEPNKDEHTDDRLVDGQPGTGIVPLGEVARVDWLTDHIKSVEEAERQGFRW